MTFTVELTPEIEAALQQQAAQRGQSAHDYVAALLAEAIEDALDVAEADRIMAASNPQERVSWEQIKAEANL